MVHHTSTEREEDVSDLMDAFYYNWVEIIHLAPCSLLIFLILLLNNKLVEYIAKNTDFKQK